MKILHTADWHIGKILKKQELRAEMELFFDWLLSVIDQENVDVLLISGDIFDSYNPRVVDREFYYSMLESLGATGVKTIITGGNHDSIAVLNAPRPLLKKHNVVVIGGATDNLSDELIPCTDSTGLQQCVIAAVPYLRDNNLINNTDLESSRNRLDQLKLGYAQHYQDLLALAKQTYPNLPILAMGHLYAQGVSSSESERDIQIGYQDAISSSLFDGYDYVALGHIHRPQLVNKQETIRYSGSPVALSFSEKEDTKIILLLEVVANKVTTISPITIPKQRNLARVSGTMEEVRVKLNAFENTYTLPAFLEVIIREEEYNSLLIMEAETMVAQFNASSTQAKVIKHNFEFVNQVKDTANLFEAGTRIEQLTPIDIFQKLLEAQNETEENSSELIQTFHELLQTYQSDLYADS